ncbi:MAG: cation transporter [Solirubrobacteraceae bacterium]
MLRRARPLSALRRVRTLASGAHPSTSWLGVAVALAAIVIMPVLARAKHRVAAQLDSSAADGDAVQASLCAIAAAGVLVGILASAALGWWWLDPIVGLGIAVLAVREAREAWAGEACDDCTPVGFGTAARPKPSVGRS